MGKFLKYTSCILTFLGALNWGLVGIFGFDLIAKIFGEMTVAARIVYILIGISAITSAIICYLSRREYNCHNL